MTLKKYVALETETSATLIILIIFGEEYKLRSSSLCSFLKYPVTSSLFVPNILLSTLVSNNLTIYSPVMSETIKHMHILIARRAFHKRVPLMTHIDNRVSFSVICNKFSFRA
jgi:hypothetical protein